MSTPEDIVDANRPVLHLATHVHASCLDSQVILLDLRSGKYVGLGGTMSAVVASSLTPDRRHLVASGDDHATRHAFNKAMVPLLSQGLLTQEAQTENPPTFLDHTSDSLDVGEAAQRVSISALDPWLFTLATVRATMWLRLRSLHAIQSAVIARRRRRHLTVPVATTDRICNAVAVFDRLRPLFFSSRNRCLHDSLTLVNFLASRGLAAHWVIGVKTRPFGAHSWVQCGGTVLNDLHERTRRYQPILVV